MAGCLLVTKLVFSFELSAAGAKRGVRSLSMRTVPSRRSTQAQPAEGRPGPSDDDDDDYDDDDDDDTADGGMERDETTVLEENYDDNDDDDDYDDDDDSADGGMEG